jgi:hypothetical protein
LHFSRPLPALHGSDAYLLADQLKLSSRTLLKGPQTPVVILRFPRTLRAWHHYRLNRSVERSDLSAAAAICQQAVAI